MINSLHYIWDWFLGLDGSAQVALLTAIGGGLALIGRGVYRLLQDRRIARLTNGTLGTARHAPTTTPVVLPFGVPPVPPLFVGRALDLASLRNRLRRSCESSGYLQLLTVVRGLPGVGKSTIAAVLATDPIINSVFPAGVLWLSLGQSPLVLSLLNAWGRALGCNEFKTIEQGSAQLRGILGSKVSAQ